MMEFGQALGMTLLTCCLTTITHAVPLQPSENDIKDLDNMVPDLNTDLGEDLGWDLEDPEFELGDYGLEPPMEKRFLPWYLFKNGGKPITPEKLRKARAQKRNDLEIVTFPCFRKSDAVCHNGGRGPRVMRKGKGGMAMCACRCPFGYTEPRCNKSWWNQ